MRYAFILLIFSIEIGIQSFEEELVKFSREFLENNFSVFKFREDVVLSELNYKTKSLEKRWGLSGTISRQRDKLEKGPRDNALPESQKRVYGINIVKDFSLGGSLTFSNEFPKTLSAHQKHYGPIQSLSYTQDLGANLLGRKYGGELKQSRLSMEYTRAFKNENVQEELRRFIREYMELRLSKTLLALEKEALKRARKRLSFVRERVQNGLREQVDLYQSQTALLSRQEQLNNVNVRLMTSLKAVSKRLARDVREGEFSSFSFEKKRPITPPTGILKDNLALKSLKAKKKQEEVALQRSQYDLRPKFRLKTEYRSNDYDSSGSKAFNRAQIFSDSQNDFFETSLSLEMPLSFQQERIEVQKAKALFNISSRHYDFRKGELKRNVEGLLYHIGEIEKKLVSVRERLLLAQKSLSEYNNLYRLGRVNLDQVIRAEEELINTQKNLADNLFSQRDLYLQLASLYGNLKDYLKI